MVLNPRDGKNDLRRQLSEKSFTELGTNTMRQAFQPIVRPLKIMRGHALNHAPVIMRHPDVGNRDALQSNRGRCACGGSCPRCKSSLVSEPGDALESAADVMAERALRGTGYPQPRGDAASENGETRSTKSLATAAGSVAAAVPPAVQNVIESPGASLTEGIRNDMENRFGMGLDGVRIHTGDQAAESARLIGAQAYTLGSHIVFGQDRYAPHTPSGRRLVAHELAHVIQQSNGHAPRIARQCDPAWSGLDWATRVANGKAMAGAARNQCLVDMIQEVLGSQAHLHESSNGAASVNAAITAGNYVEIGTIADRHINFDRNLNAKTHNANQYGEARYRTSADGSSISLYVILGPQALNPGSRDVTQMAFDHEVQHTDDFLLQWATGTPHAATAGEELAIYQAGFERHFLDLLTIDSATCSWSLADSFTPLFDYYATADPAARDAAFASMEMFYDVRIQGIPCNLMKYKIWLQSMLNARPASDLLAQRLNGLPGLALTRGDPPTTHLTCPTTCT